MAVKKFKALDSDFTAVIKLVAELRGGEFAVRSLTCEIGNAIHHLRDGRPQKKMIVCDLVDLSHPAQQLKNAPHVGLTDTELSRNIADAWRPEALLAADQRHDASPRLFILRCQTRFM